MGMIQYYHITCQSVNQAICIFIIVPIVLSFCFNKMYYCIKWWQGVEMSIFYDFGSHLPQNTVFGTSYPLIVLMYHRNEQLNYDRKREWRSLTPWDHWPPGITNPLGSLTSWDHWPYIWKSWDFFVKIGDEFSSKYFLCCSGISPVFTFFYVMSLCLTIVNN